MKILQVIPSYEPAWAFGGTVTATVNLCRGLAKKGIDVTVYTTDADGKGGYLDVPLNQPVNLGGVKVWYFHCDFMPKKAFYSKELCNSLDKNIRIFDIVDTSSLWQWYPVVVARICKRAEKPFIITPHSSLMKWSFEEVGMKIPKKIFWLAYLKNVIKNASCIRFLSIGEREASKDYSYRTPSFIVPNGINTDEILAKINIDKNKLRKQFGLPKESVVLLYLGRIHPKKNLDLIVKAIEQISEDNICLLVVGPVEDHSYFMSIRKYIDEKKMGNKIKWFAEVENKKVFEFYSVSDLFLLPSKSEGVSMATIEAQICGLPVMVSNRVANYAEIIEDNSGIVVEPDVDSISQGLIEITENRKKLDFLSENAKKTALLRYSIDKVVDLMIKAYEDILCGRKSLELKWE